MSAILTPERLADIQSLLADADVDGWLLYDFRGANPIALGLLGHARPGSRRIVVWIPRSGLPAALSHAIEQRVWATWPTAWPRTVYSSWQDLERFVVSHVAGRRVAMEYSPGGGVPTVDRVPAGVVDMVRAAGATVTTSAQLITRLYAAWTPEQTASHERAAERIATIAHDAARLAGERASAGTPMTEYALVEWIAERFAEAGLVTASLPHVAAGVNAADPHYGPSAEASALIVRDQLLLIDLWAREPGGIYADQTWMASLGPPSARAVEVWTAVRDARDAAAQLLRERLWHGVDVQGAEADDAARGVLQSRGMAQWFAHRTGHSIDARELHGAGPNLDNLESRDDRLLVPGIGFSIEPGVYIPGEIGVRSEVNAYVGVDGLVVTPRTPQQELWIV
jgi:Xaa-Pro aminopeptidase